MPLGQDIKVFSRLNLSGYRQVSLATESREITALSTSSGHFEWLRMPICLKSAPTTFLKLDASHS